MTLSIARKLPPEGWEYVQLRRVATIQNGADYKPVEMEQGGYPVYGSGGEFRRASEYLYDGESVLFGRKGTIDRPIHVSGRFWTVDTMFYTRLSDRVVGRYLYYYATTMPYSYYSTSTALPSMTQGDLSGHTMPLPPVEEQRAIADFLDEQTSRIDTLIGKQTQLIDTLGERRIAVVREVLERGLKGSAPTEGTAVEWLSSTPAGWATPRLSWVFRQIGSGTTPANEDQLDAGLGDVSWVTTGELRESTITSTTRTVSHETVLKLGALKVYPAGSLIIAMYGATIGRLGTLGIPATVNQACCVLADCRAGTPRFYEYVLLAARDHLINLATGGGQPNISQETVRSLRVPSPPPIEQGEIVAYLDDQTSRIDTLIARTEKFVGLARERRSALISAAVTGQIDVRTAGRAATVGA